ncbi:MAG: hypothetical protein HOV92_24910 [Streptomyces sp.]|nr:hypothetical protein [Streptomyces sp.]
MARRWFGRRKRAGRPATPGNHVPQASVSRAPAAQAPLQQTSVPETSVDFLHAAPHRPASPDAPVDQSAWHDDDASREARWAALREASDTE